MRTCTDLSDNVTAGADKFVVIAD